jgi:hypothetical protein
MVSSVGRSPTTRTKPALLLPTPSWVHKEAARLLMSTPVAWSPQTPSTKP